MRLLYKSIINSLRDLRYKKSYRYWEEVEKISLMVRWISQSFNMNRNKNKILMCHRNILTEKKSLMLKDLKWLSTIFKDRGKDWFNRDKHIKIYKGSLELSVKL